MLRNIIIFAVSACLSACSSTPSITPQAKYYVLDALPPAEVNSEAKQLIAVKPISVPAYLDQPNLVMREADQGIIVANYHSWADNLPDSIRRVMRAELNRAGLDYYFTENCQGCDALNITIEHFYPTTAGEVYLAGSYQLHNKQYSFNLQKTMQESGYNEAVRQMRALLVELSKQIKGGLKSGIAD